MKIIRTVEMAHPILKSCIDRIQRELIDYHSIPMKIFETGRVHDRHNVLINRGKTKDIMSGHLFNLENDPPLYATAVDYVYYDDKWSWNLRDSTIASWYSLFGNVVLDVCPELQWGGQKRKAVNFCHFQLRRDVIVDSIDTIPCAVLN